MAGVVVKQANDDAPDARHGRSWIGTPWIGEILHFAAVSAGEPIRSVFEFRELVRAHHATQVETERFRPVHNPRRVPWRCHLEDCAAAEQFTREGKARKRVIASKGIS